MGSSLMASAWGDSWSKAWGNSWGAVEQTTAGRPWDEDPLEQIEQEDLEVIGLVIAFLNATR